MQFYHQMGISQFHGEFLFALIEPEKGRWEWSSYDTLLDTAEKNNLKVIATVGYSTPWINRKFYIPKERHKEFIYFATELVERYGNRIATYELAHHRHWTGSIAEYEELMRKTLLAMKEINPYITVVASKPFSSLLKGVSIHLERDTPPNMIIELDKQISSIREKGFKGSLWVTEIKGSKTLNATDTIELLTYLATRPIKVANWETITGFHDPRLRDNLLNSPEIMALRFILPRIKKNQFQTYVNSEGKERGILFTNKGKALLVIPDPKSWKREPLPIGGRLYDPLTQKSSSIVAGVPLPYGYDSLVVIISE